MVLSKKQHRVVQPGLRAAVSPKRQGRLLLERHRQRSLPRLRPDDLAHTRLGSQGELGRGGRILHGMAEASGATLWNDLAGEAKAKDIPFWLQ